MGRSADSCGTKFTAAAAAAATATAGSSSGAGSVRDLIRLSLGPEAGSFVRSALWS